MGSLPYWRPLLQNHRPWTYLRPSLDMEQHSFLDCRLWLLSFTRLWCEYLPAEKLDEAVYAFCDRLLNGATDAIRWTKVLTNMELKRITHAVLDTGLAYEAVSMRSADHREAVKALQEKRKPSFADKGSKSSSTDD